MLWVHPLGVSMSDGDTRKVNEEVLKDPNAKWKPLEQPGFERADQIWVHRQGFI